MDQPGLQPSAGEYDIVQKVSCPDCAAPPKYKCTYLQGKRKDSYMNRVHAGRAQRFHGQEHDHA